MNIGAICYDTCQGLGIIAKSFYNAGVVNRVLIVPHPHYKRYPNWYPNSIRFNINKWEAFLHGLDILLLYENGFRWDIVKTAQQRGIKIVLIPNYEYTPYPIPVRPNLIICASLLDIDYYHNDYNTVFIPIPVDTKWKMRERARVFVHNAGNGGRGYRTGAPEILEAMEYVRSPIRLIMRAQPHEKRMQDLFRRKNWLADKRITIVHAHVPKDELYATGDVSVNPDKYNGMSLPLQEARAAGLVVMTTDRYPMNTWLPKEPLIPVDHYEKDKIAVEFDRAVVTPQAIAAKIDEWYNRDIRSYSISGKKWAEENSWEALKPKYLEAFQCL